MEGSVCTAGADTAGRAGTGVGLRLPEGPPPLALTTLEERRIAADAGARRAARLAAKEALAAEG